MPLTFATCGRNVNESKDFGLDVFPGRFEDTGKTMQLLRGREGKYRRVLINSHIHDVCVCYYVRTVMTWNIL